MNFKAYKIWQKEFLETNPKVFRADCLNPFKSMDYLLKDVSFTKEKRDKKELYALWSKVNGTQISNENLAFSRGVRDSLGILFAFFKERDIFIPHDIYPRYFELSKENRVKSFTTYPKMDWEFLKTIENSVILLTIPFTPVGRVLEEDALKEIEVVIKNGNHLIIDSVYDYDLKNNFKKLKVLLESERVFWLHSLSKTYLSPEILGINYVPRAYKIYFENSWKNSLNEMNDFSRPYDILTQKPNFSNLQSEEFMKGFDFLSENTGLDIYESEIAYFAVVEESFESLLKHNILAVPASVFGSKRDDLTVVTGLYYLSGMENSK